MKEPNLIAKYDWIVWYMLKHHVGIEEAKTTHDILTEQKD